MNGATSLLPPYVSTKASARWLTGFLIASCAIAWVAVGFDFAEIRLHSRVAGGVSAAEGERGAFALIESVVRVAQVTLLCATGALFISWLYRSRVNVRAFGTRKLRFTRNWTIFGFLIPVANLVLPYRVIREVWQASDPEAKEPLDWMIVKPGRLLLVWWSAFVGWGVLSLFSLFLENSAGFSPTRLLHAGSITLLADMAGAVAASLAYFVVASISEAQDEKWERLADRDA